MPTQTAPGQSGCPGRIPAPTMRGHVALITGAAGGMGLATAQSLTRRGARVVIADLDEQRATTAASGINESGGHAVAVRCDVSRDDDIEKLKEVALERFGRIDIVMNNAATTTRGLPEHIPMGEWSRVLDVDLLSVARSIRTFVPMLIEQRRGHIVNTASFSGLLTYSYDRLPYAAAKAAMVQISEGLRLYLDQHHVGVTVLCPGPVLTRFATSPPPSFGPATATRGPGPQFGLLEPAVVGEMVATAIEHNTFMVYTHNEVRDLLIARATDWNAFIAHQCTQMTDPPV